MSKEKETIIDGVNVAECMNYSFKEFINFTEYPDYCADYLDHICINHSDCYYKQLKRLQQENEELKKRCEELDKMTGIFSARLADKYKQALEEIRSYCDEQNLKADYTACYITNKIDEVLNE